MPRFFSLWQFADLTNEELVMHASMNDQIKSLQREYIERKYRGQGLASCFWFSAGSIIFNLIAHNKFEVNGTVVMVAVAVSLLLNSIKRVDIAKSLCMFGIEPRD